MATFTLTNVCSEISRALTSDSEIDGVALSGAVPVGGEAVIVARVGHRDALHDQAPVAHDHAAVLVVTQRSSLELYSGTLSYQSGNFFVRDLRLF